MIADVLQSRCTTTRVQGMKKKALQVKMWKVISVLGVWPVRQEDDSYIWFLEVNIRAQHEPQLLDLVSRLRLGFSFVHSLGKS